MKTTIITITFLLSTAFSLLAQNHSKVLSPDSLGLISENMLHPVDASTAYTFKKGEWAYNQALTPYPSWAWWGVTDFLTIELDFEAWLGGVPSFNLRFALSEQKHLKPAIAFETMYQFLSNEFDLLEDYEYLNINRKGNSWYNRVNLSWEVSKKSYLHLSTGATYSEMLVIENNDTTNYKGNRYSNLISPDFSISIDYRFKKWISLHLTGSYGSTFLYLDNVPLKQQVAIGTRLAPFINDKLGFLRNFRIEIAIISFYFKDADERVGGPIGFIYWQWN
jgi:hypothetical protein